MSDPIDRISEALSWSARAFGDYSDDIHTLLDRLDAAKAENERMRAVVSALAFQASRDPFVSVGHWCEHGPCAAIIRDISNPNADHHGPDWTERDSEYLK